MTDAEGRYSFNAVPPTGKWTLTAELPGFATQNREGLEFQANTRPEINFQLGVGGVQEVDHACSACRRWSARAKASCRRSSTRSRSMRCPTNGRNFLSLLADVRQRRADRRNGSSAVSVNGQGTRMANFVADGVSMTGREIRTVNGEFGGGNGLSLDVVKELQVITNGFKAETGQTGAGTISVVTKSGTNTIAGSAYGFWRPTDLVAANLLTGAQDARRSGSSSAARSADRSRRTSTHYFANYEDTKIDDAVGRDLGAGARHVPDAAAAAAGLLQAEPPVQRPQRARRALQLQPQPAGRRRASAG